MHGSGFIAAFVGGAVFGAVRREVGGEVNLFLEQAGGLLGAVTFILFGAVMLVPMLDDLTVEIVLYALLSLTVVRMVPVALAMLGSGARRPTVAFLGWFGPRGLASIVFAVILVEDANLANESVLLNTIFLTIGLSVLLHGVTATPLAARYAAWFAAHPRDDVPGFESAPAPTQRPHGWAAGLLHRHRDVRRRAARDGVLVASSDEQRSGLSDAAGRAALFPARAAARVWRDQLEAAADEVLSAPEIARVIDRALAGSLARGDRALDRSPPRPRACGR